MRTNRIQQVWLPDVVENFKNIAKCMELPAKTALFFKGDPADCVYFLESGVVSMFHYTEEGETIAFLYHHKGDLIGIGGVLDNTSREVCSETSTRCRLWVIQKDDFIDMMYKYSSIAVWVAAELSHRMKRIDVKVLRAISMSAERKIAATLMDLLPYQKETSRDNPAVIKITHQDLSNLSGTCRQTTTTILGSFKEQGLISTRKGSIEIYDPEGLKEIIGLNEM